jgi:DNA polymerase I
MILIDANGICHQMKHSIGDLSWEEKQVGIIFGFMRQLLSLSKLFGPDSFVFAWDSPSSKRKEIFPEYKANRKREKTKEEQDFDNMAYDQFDQIRSHVLPKIGFRNIFVQNGFEADDIMASIIQSNPVKTTIISTDEDLYQLLSEQVSLYSLKKKQFYTHISLWKEFRITPSEWIETKAIAGCSSDGIPGVPGVGEKTACKYLNGKLNHTYKTYKSIKENGQLIARNRKLVKLPYEGTNAFNILFKEKLDMGGFLDICDEYGFASFLREETFGLWKKYFFER